MAEEGAAPAAPTAGGLLRQAREAQGLHIAVLAATLKVPQRKLEALERDRLDDLPDATFARALAQTVCRALKIDAAPVLALLPPAAGAGLEQVAAGLNTPFRDKPTTHDLAPASWLRHPALVVVVLLLAGAAVLWFWPRGGDIELPSPSLPTITEPVPVLPPMPATEAASEPLASSASAPVAAVAPPDAASAAEVAQVVPPATGTDPATVAGMPLLTVRTTGESWVEVVDAGGRTLLSRVVAAGEDVVLDDGAPPLRIVVGNAAATTLRFRGQAVDLVPSGGTNVARVELK